MIGMRHDFREPGKYEWQPFRSPISMPTLTNATSQKSGASSSPSFSSLLKAPEISQAPSDSMHHISTFPAPPEGRSAEISHASSASKRASSPELLTVDDVMTMRRRVQELCLLDAGSQNGSGRNINSAPHFSARERELVDMVLFMKLLRQT